MCGIAGIIDSKAAKKEKTIANMVKVIAHRGPDDDGFFVDKHVGLGMRRLAIIDLKTGRQPITSHDDKLLIFFNGEIYNYQDLHQDLLKKGYEFKTKSDTETILHLYEQYGEKMLPKLRGMFTFCIYDTEKKTIFLARDYFGIKPLYYLTSGDKITAFSSEIKSFLTMPGFKSEINHSAVYNYLSFQYNPLTETFWKGVYKLPPAHFMKIDLVTGKTDINPYWSFKFDQENNLDRERTIQEIYDRIEDSVAHHMIADVPVGAFLSGGVDSSVITTLMQRVRGDNPKGKQASNGAGKIKTFTVGFESLSEGKESKETSDFLGTDHTEISVGADEYFKALEDAVYHFDEPVADPSAIGIYFLAREAKKHVKVVLSGEGSDELFGGYNIYLAPLAKQKLAFLPKLLIKPFINLPFEYFGKNYLRRVNTKLESWYFGQKYFNKSIFEREEIQRMWKGSKEKFLPLNNLYKQTTNWSDSTKMQYIDINTWLVGDILAKADKMTMAHSLELRVPFLDKDVSEIAAILPDDMKWNQGITKFAFRQAFRNIIPESTRNRKKLGFPTPIKNWLTKERQGVYKTILENKYIKQNLDTDYIQNLIDNHLAKKEDNSRKIYTLLMLALWYNVFIDS